MQNKPNHMPLSEAEKDPYREHMKAMFGDTRLPAVIVKGELIKERML